jgi:phosphate-selective porin OprO/OprP
LSNKFFSHINEYPTISQINKAGQALFIWNITGEDFSWGFTKPLNNFKPFDKYNIGAFQLGLRYSMLNIDPNTFNYYNTTNDGRIIYKYSDPRISVQRADGYSLVLNWSWNINFKLSTEFSYTKFKGGCSTGALNSPINPGCSTAPYSSISQPGSTILNRPSEIAIFQQATAIF